MKYIYLINIILGLGFSIMAENNKDPEGMAAWAYSSLGWSAAFIASI